MSLIPTKPLTPAELEVMKVVWDRGEATVRDVYETMRDRRRLAYTTIMTTMKVLEEKGHLEKREKDRAYVYRPTRPQAAVVGSMVREFVERVFDGAVQPLLVHLVKERKLTRREVAELKRAIEERGE
jgi:predicted transcriptional regulator